MNPIFPFDPNEPFERQPPEDDYDIFDGDDDYFEE